MPAVVFAPVLASMFGKQAAKKSLFSSFGKRAPKKSSVELPSKSQTRWILIIVIIVFVFSGVVFLTYNLIEDFEGNSKSKKIKTLINKKTNEYTFGREGFSGSEPEPFNTKKSLKGLNYPIETNYSEIERRSHTKRDNIDNKKKVKYNLRKLS
jgi:hypothetical protein